MAGKAVRFCLVALLLLPATSSSQLVQLRHWTGQSVAPVYEGFDANPDGTFNMWFGYLNRNYEEQLDIPVGPDNNFEPGGDRGQPTHFMLRRHKDVFKVVVPKDFGDQKLVWARPSRSPGRSSRCGRSTGCAPRAAEILTCMAHRPC